MTDETYFEFALNCEQLGKTIERTEFAENEG